VPALPNAPKVVRHVLRFTYQENVDIVNRFYQQYSGSGPIADMDMLAWATAVSNAWGAHMVAAVAIPLVLNSVTSTELTSATGSEQQYVNDVPGTSTGTPLPANVAMVIREHIERRYRGGHPRQYIAGLTANEQHDAQSWDPSSVAAIHTDYVNFRTACAAGCPSGAQPAVDVNVSYYSGFTNHTYPSGRVRPVPTLRGAPVIDVIAAFSVNPKIASQRRRTLQSS
jgi:hypothetical protein